ncbi:MAG: thioredoxin family protein [bacterium]
MKLYFKKFNKKNLVFPFILLLIFAAILINSTVFAVNKPRVILFCTKWNAKCKNVRPVLESVINTYNNKVDLMELDLDQNTTPEKARSMRIIIPREIPYIVVIGKNENIIAEKAYHGESPEQLKSEMDQVILPQL